MKNQKIKDEELDDFMDNRFQYSLNIGLETTLKKIFEINKEDINTCLKYFKKCETIGWPSEFSKEDISLSKKFEFNSKKIVEEDNFVKFNLTKNRDKFLIKFMNEKLNINVINSFISCESYFAHLHDDKDVVEHSGQIMVVLENNGENIIYSVNESGIETTICPNAGDVIFLNIWEKHAVLPSKNKSIKKIKENPIKLLCFN